MNPFHPAISNLGFKSSCVPGLQVWFIHSSQESFLRANCNPGASLVAQLVKIPPAIQETQV